MTYIALLRGINIGGHQVKMEQLRALFTALKFKNVRSYIQTGNVFFDAPETDREALRRKIEAHLEKSLGYAVPVCLRTVPELEALIASNPFEKLTITDDMRTCITFLPEPVPAGLTLPVRSPKNDMEIIHTTTHDAFVVWYLINGRPPSGNFLEKTLKCAGTSRFFHTTVKILEAAKQ